MENLNKKTESVLIQMLQSKPIVLPSNAPSISHVVCHKRSNTCSEHLTDEDDVLIVEEEPRRWTKKRRLLEKLEKKSLSSGEDDSSGSSSGSSTSDGECCECPNDFGCDNDNEDEDDFEEGSRNRIEELCWQLEENFRENNVSF